MGFTGEGSGKAKEIRRSFVRVLESEFEAEVHAIQPVIRVFRTNQSRATGASRKPEIGITGNLIGVHSPIHNISRSNHATPIEIVVADTGP
jgi:hypothetical protein